MTSKPDTVHARIKKLIVERLFIDGLNPDELANDASLRDELGLDSVDALELLLGLEQEFGIVLVNNGVAPEVFQSVNTLAEFVEGILKQETE